MALVLADRVRETSAVTGTGSATLLGAVTGYQSFSVIGNSNTCYYTIADQAGANWEVGIGTYSTVGPTLARTTVLSSSNGGALVNFLAGTKDVFVTYPSNKAVYEDASGNVSALGTITSGTWNATTIGTPYGGTGLTSFTSGGAVYATSTSALTTGTLPVTAGGTGAATLAANGVLYGSGTGALGVTAVGSTGQVLVGNTGAAPSWATVSSSLVSSFSAGTTGFTPSTATTGAVTLAGTLNATNGGTGQSTYAVGDLLVGGATNTLTKLADVATGNALISGGVGVAPSYGKIGLTTHVSGTLPIANGGTNGTATPTLGGVAYGTGTAYALTAAGTSGQILRSNAGAAPTWENLSALGVSTISFGTTGLTPSTATSGNVTVAGTLALANGGTGKTSATAGFANLLGWTTTATAAGTTTLTASSSVQQEFTGATTQTVVLPDVTTLALGWTFDIINNSTGSLTINSSGGNLVGTLTAGTTGNVVCVLTTGTTAASWDFDIGGFSAQTGTGSVVRGTSPTFTTSVVGGATFAAFNTTTTNLSMGGAATTLALGGTTATSTYNIATGATINASTKTVNIGTAGVSGSITNINIGSAVSGATGTTTINGTIALQNALPITSGGTGATTVAAAQTNLQVDPAGTAVAMAIALG